MQCWKYIYNFYSDQKRVESKVILYIYNTDSTQENFRQLDILHDKCQNLD